MQILIMGLKLILIKISVLLISIVLSVAMKLAEHFSETKALNVDLSSLGFVVKGILFYIVTIWELYRREYFKSRIAHCDTYLLLSGVLSYIYLISAYLG